MPNLAKHDNGVLYRTDVMKPLNQFSDLVGYTLTNVCKTNDDDEIHYHLEDGRIFKSYHIQDCCEDVYVESIVGDLSYLIGSPILVAEEVEGESECGDWGSQTYTFYKLDTIKGGVTIRWVGSSNGYYSESVSFGGIHA